MPIYIGKQPLSLFKMRQPWNIKVEVRKIFSILMYMI